MRYHHLERRLKAGAQLLFDIDKDTGKWVEHVISEEQTKSAEYPKRNQERV